MASRGKDVFVTSMEFADWMRELSNELSLIVLIDRGANEPMVRWSGDPAELAGASRIFLAIDAPGVNGLGTKALNPAERGWVVVGVPRTVARTLLVCQIGARSDWWDSERSMVRENRESLRLYDRIWRRLKTRVSFPVWAKNVLTGAASPYHSLGYSEGAKEWSRSGGALAQEGLANIQFEIRDP